MLHLALHAATVTSALQSLYTNYLKLWAPLIGVIGLAVGGMTVIFAGMAGNSAAAALGIRILVVCIGGIIIVFGAVALIGIGQAIGGLL